jgi:hypothetical protein
VIDGRTRQKQLRGSERPRLAPPLPARTDVAEFSQLASRNGIDLYPWQKTAARYLTAHGRGDSWLYRHVAIVVARQSGKTTLLVPLILGRLLAGQRIMHTAQDRVLPREIFGLVAEIVSEEYPDKLARRGGRTVKPRFANGTEEIRLANGGIYSIVAPSRGGARGPARDLVIIDELREMEDFDFIAAATPTMQASRHPQMVYLSNAGEETSVVLNAIRDSAETDPSLAYLEWSAAPDRAVDDLDGWAEANPSIGHDPSAVDNLTASYQTHKARGTLSIFETEHLCRWVKTTRDSLVAEAEWSSCRGLTGSPLRPSIGVSLDPDGKRASIAISWRMADGRIALELLEDVSGDPVDTDAIGRRLKEISDKRSAKVGFDPLADQELVKYVKKDRATSISGQKYAAASAQFMNLVAAGRLVHQDADPVGDDLTWTAKKPDGTDGSFHAVRANDDRPITASLASIRAVWLSSGPAVPTARVL